MTARVLVKGEVDLVSALMGRGAAMDLVVEPPARIEVFAQQLEEMRRTGSPDSVTRAVDSDIEVVVLSLAGDLTRDLLRHRTTGELVDSPRSEDDLDLLERVEGDFERAASQVVERLASSTDPLIVWFTASTVSGSGEPHQWEGDQRPFSVLANRLNLAIARLSQATGVCFVDADRLIAELGAGCHVQGPFQYSSEASERLAEEFERILIETGRLAPPGYQAMGSE